MPTKQKNYNNGRKRRKSIDKSLYKGNMQWIKRVNTLHVRKAISKVGSRKHHLALIHIIIFWEVFISNQ